MDMSLSPTDKSSLAETRSKYVYNTWGKVIMGNYHVSLLVYMESLKTECALQTVALPFIMITVVFPSVIHR